MNLQESRRDRPGVVAALVLTCACSAPTAPRDPTRPTAPTPLTAPTPPPVTYPPVEITGAVTAADTAAPLGGTTIFLNGRYQATADGSGHYRLDGLLDNGSLANGDNVLWTSVDGYDQDVRYARSVTEDFRLHGVRRFAIGGPVSVTVLPDDALCYNEVQDPSFGEHDYVCRILHTTVPADGVLTVDAVSSHGQRFPLVVQSAGHECCDVANPVSFHARGGAEVVIFVELPSSATASETFVITTAMSSGPAAGQ